jgi:predicted O-methyltransferase YrrM
MTLKDCSNIFSTSEENGIKILTPYDKKIYSVGISTGGVAEIRMLADHSERHIISTTIDAKGAEFAKRQVDNMGLTNRIEIKIEDVSPTLTLSSRVF